jgi:hypothetical protein
VIGAAVLALGLALAAPQVLPALELSRMSHRAAAATEAGFQAYAAYALSPKNWITLLVPDYYGLPARGDFWGGWSYGAPNVMEYAGHVGTAAFALAIVGLAWGWRVDRRALLAAALALLALLLASGGPLSRLLYFHLPGFSQLGSPARILVLFCLAQALLAALGAEWLLRRAETGWKTAVRDLGIAAAAVLALLGALHALALATIPVRNAEPLLEAVSHPALGRAALYAVMLFLAAALMLWLLRENTAAQRTGTLGGTLAAVVAGGLLFLGGAYNPTAPPELAYPETPLTRALREAPGRIATLNRTWSLARVPDALLPPNSSLAYGWRDAQGYDSLLFGHYRRLLNAVNAPEDASPPENGNMVFIKRADSPLLPLLGARYLVSQAPLRREGLFPPDGFPPGPPHVYRDGRALPEAYTVPSYFVAPDAEALSRLRQFAPEELARTAALAPAPDLPRPTACAPPAAGAAATVERPAPGRLRVRVPGGSTAPLLVVAEGYAPGWRAVVHAAGRAPYPARVFRANVAFLGVVVPPGPVTVEWRYEPASFHAGLFFALVALGALLAAVVLRHRRRA